jgi:hypothetical protein
LRQSRLISNASVRHFHAGAFANALTQPCCKTCKISKCALDFRAIIILLMWRVWWTVVDTPVACLRPAEPRCHLNAVVYEVARQAVHLGVWLQSRSAGRTRQSGQHMHCSWRHPTTSNQLVVTEAVGGVWLTTGAPTGCKQPAGSFRTTCTWIFLHSQGGCESRFAARDAGCGM